jgi:hypothetical protein
MTEKPKRIPSVAACRAAQGRLPSGEIDGAKLKEIDRAAHQLAALPPDERAAAALKVFPPSNLREALYHYAKGVTPAEACKKSGANPNAFDLYLRSEPAGHALRQVMRGVIETEYAPAGFSFLHSAVHDTDMPARCRIDAAKIIVDRAGYVASPPTKDEAGRDLQEMSVSELEALIRKLESERGVAAKDVTPETPVEDEDEGDGAKRAIAPPPADDAPPQPR